MNSPQLNRIVVTFVSVLLAAAAPLHAQGAGSLDLGFNPNANGGIRGLAVQPDGKVLLGGLFTTISGQARTRIARLNADGTLESTATFNPGAGASDSVQNLAVQPDGHILIVGAFTSVDGQTRNRIARLNPDGSLEGTVTFNPGAGANNTINSVAVQSDGKIVIAGTFTSFDGQTRNRIARLNPDGTLESTATFNPGTGANGTVNCAAVQSDGRILLSGGFTTVNGQARTRIARLNADGTLESTATFNPGAGANNTVNCVMVQADGKILLGGAFTTVDSQTRNRVARLQSDGTLEGTATFDPGTGADDSVLGLALQTDGKILLTGRFVNVNAQPRGLVARLNPDGTVESTATFNIGSGLTAGSFVTSVALQQDGRILIGGGFLTVNGVGRNYIARIYNDVATAGITVPDRTRVQWLRGGAAAETPQATFELSTDGGVNWSVLGAGTRITGGWERTGLSLPASGTIRARARPISGSASGGAGLIETVAAFLPLDEADISVFAGPSPAAPALANGQVSPTDFGNAQLNNPSTRIFAVKNVGLASLTGLSVTVAGSEAGAFLSGGLPATLAPGATALLRVDFVPSSVGAKAAAINIASNDPDENPFAVNVTGTGTTLPVVSVSVDRSSVAEDGTNNLRFAFKRSSTGASLTANFAVGGTGTFGGDYTASGAASFSATVGAVTFGPNSSSVTVTVDPIADTVIEPEESIVFTVTPSATYAAGLTDGLTDGATGWITNDDLDAAAAGFPAIFTTADKATAGLTGSYVNSSLRAVNEADWRLTRPISGSRVDATVNFGTADWGARAGVGVTGGTDADWNQFSVQWDGWLEVTTQQRLALASDDGSRMWVDLNGDGVFGSTGAEFINNGWGTGHATTTVESLPVPPGIYRIRIQYEEGSGGTVARLTTRGGTYTDVLGFDRDLTPWEGTSVVYLTASRNLDPAVMALLLKATDDAYDFYFQATGRAPNNFRLYNGKLPIAQVPATSCGGAACGFLGSTGIEMLYPYFTDLYDGARLKHQYSQVPFYELGRNFWFYGSQLAYKSPDDGGTVTTGFATTMRNILMEALGIAGTPFNNRPWPDHARHVKGIVDGYVRNPANDWFNTMRVGVGATDVSTVGSTALFSSMNQRLRRDYPRPGESFLHDLWTTAGTYPAATTSLEAVDNYFLAACAGTTLNLTNLLETSWKFPLSTNAKSAAQTLYGSSVPASPAPEILVPTNGVWRYKDDGSNQGTAWKEPGFNDNTWAAGPAELGYGEGDEATVIDDSPSPTYVSPASNRYITSYFRHAFTVADPGRYASLALYLKRDDGAVVYLNGVEIIRDNIAEGAFTHLQPAVGNIANSDEPLFFVYEIAASHLVAGGNVLAVEVHQSSASNDDVSFAAELAGMPISPEIAVFTGTTTMAATERFDNSGTHNFGSVIVGASQGPQTFTIRNSGVGTLTGLGVSKSGLHPGDFTLVPLGVTSLPGNSKATFAVTFAPTAPGPRSAVAEITSSDSDEGVFRLNVSGTGLLASDIDGDGLLDAWELTYWTTTAGHSALDDFDFDGVPELLEEAFGLNPTLPDAANLPQAVNEGGYLTITLTKNPGVTYEVQSAGTLENGQPDSFSAAITTVLINNATTLKVRDNIPYGTPPARYMRIKVTAAP